MINAELECNARPLSPQMTEAFDKISKQVCSLSEQIAHLQLSVDGMQQPVDSKMAANHGMPTASSSITQARAAKSPCLELEAQVGLSSGLSSVQEAVDEWFTGLHGFPAPPTLCEQAVQRGQRLSKKAIDNMSKRRHLPLRIQALATGLNPKQTHWTRFPSCHIVPPRLKNTLQTRLCLSCRTASFLSGISMQCLGPLVAVVCCDSRHVRAHEATKTNLQAYQCPVSGWATMC